MRKIIPLRSLLGSSIIIGLCSLFIAADINLIFSANTCRVVNFSHLTQNRILQINNDCLSLAHTSTMILKISVMMTIIFVFALISSSLEIHYPQLITLLIIGATKRQVITLFLFAIAKSFLLASITGSILGVFGSPLLFDLYHSTDYGPDGLITAFHLSAISYTMLIFVGIFPCTVFFLIKKFISIGLLSLGHDKSHNMARISTIRLLSAVISLVALIFFILTVKSETEASGNKNVMTLLCLQTISIYLLIPIILKTIMPMIFAVIRTTFPITGMLAQRYFAATIRRYTSIAAPIIVCLVFSIMWFFAVSAGVELNKRIILSSDVHLTAVTHNIPVNDRKDIKQYRAIQSQIKNSSTTVIREDLRWAIRANYTNIPLLLEVNPQALTKIFPVKVVEGDLNHVHGTNIAAIGINNKLGSTIHLISPAGKEIVAHIVALIQSPYFAFNNHKEYFVDFFSFPETQTLDRHWDLANEDLLAPQPNVLNIYYGGISAKQLQKHDIPAISAQKWVDQAVSDRYVSINKQKIMTIAPAIGICLALVLINGISFGSRSRYLRRTIAILGGSAWQDIKTTLVEIGSIFLLAIAIAPLPAFLEQWLLKSFYHAYHVDHFPLIYPYHQEIVLLVLFIVATLTPPLAKMLYLRRKQFSIID